MIARYHDPLPGAAPLALAEMDTPGCKEQLGANLRRNFTICAPGAGAWAVRCEAVHA